MMKRFMSGMTSKQASGRLTAFIVAVVFALGTLFVPTGGIVSEADDDGAVVNGSVETKTTAAENDPDEAADAEIVETDTDKEDTDGSLTGSQPGETETEAQPADAETSGAVAELEKLVTVKDEDGETADLEDLDESAYDGFIYKIKDDVTKQEIKEMETAIDKLDEDPDSGAAEELIDNELYTADSLETIEAVAEPDMIEYIEPDYVISLMGTNDYYYESDGWFLEMIKAPYVWERGAFGKGIVVAVLDTGVLTSHSDFESTHFVDPYNAVDESDDVTDTNGHGTGMAGIIAASYNNETGLTGIMPEASIMPIKVFDGKSNMSTTAMVIKGIDYASQHGADVINMSLGGPEESPGMNEACERAAAKGAILVSAAGNSGDSTAFYPAAYSSVVSVGSIESDGAHTDQSTYNKYVDAVAPGRGIRMPYAATGNDCYRLLTGTSASAPQVAAMAAMVKSMDESVNVKGFKEILSMTCIDKGAVGRDNYFGYGLIDLSRAYRYMTGSLGLYKATLSYTSYVYNGKPRSPAVTVTKTAKNLPNTNYKVTYPKNRTAVGTYKVTVTGLGKYTGAKTLKYKIVPPLIKKIKKPKRYKRKLKVKWYVLSTAQQTKYKSAITGFQVRVSKNSNFTKAKYVKVKGIARSEATVKGLKRKTKYYVQYRAYKTVGSVTYYSKWSSKKKTKTK